MHKTQHNSKSNKQHRPQGESWAAVHNAYVTAFGKHYPQYAVEITRAKSRDGVPMFNVVLNGDKGDRPMSLDEMKEATSAFLH